MAPKTKEKASVQPPPSTKRLTIGEQEQADYLASRPYQVLFDTKGFAGLTAAEKLAYANYRLLDTEAYLTWTVAQQEDFLKICEQQKIPFPLRKPTARGKDSEGRPFSDYYPEEYEAWRHARLEILELKKASAKFRDRSFGERVKIWRGDTPLSLRSRGAVRTQDTEGEAVDEKRPGRRTVQGPVTPEEIKEEKERRLKIAEMEHSKKPERYSGDPEWDDVKPIPQDDGENPLAAIAYTDEYAEAITYLRAVMAAQEHSPRILDLTAHIISLNPAHYTVWLYRASTLFALNSDLTVELEWVNDVALANQKNYQIWHHRQLLIDKMFPDIANDPAQVKNLAKSEVDFITQMFEKDSKNYHVWSYRQYLVRKLSLFPSQSPDPSELASVETLLHEDIRNNSAWSHRFFIVFSDPGYSTSGSAATAADNAIPDEILEREIRFSESAIIIAPQNQSPWNYLRGVLRKGGRGLNTLEGFAGEFVKFGVGDGTGEDVKSSHALDFLSDCWIEMGELEKADRALRLLGDKYDIVRKNYWEWRRTALRDGKKPSPDLKS